MVPVERIQFGESVLRLRRNLLRGECAEQSVRKKTILIIAAAGVTAAFLFYKLKNSRGTTAAPAVNVGGSVAAVAGVAPIAA